MVQPVYNFTVQQLNGTFKCLGFYHFLKYTSLHHFTFFLISPFFTLCAILKPRVTPSVSLLSLFQSLYKFLDAIIMKCLYSIQNALFVPQGGIRGKQVCKHKYTNNPYIHIKTMKMLNISNNIPHHKRQIMSKSEII